MAKDFYVGNPNLSRSLKSSHRRRWSKVTRIQEQQFDGNKPVIDKEGKPVMVSRNIRQWLDGAPSLKQFAKEKGHAKMKGQWA